MSSVLVPDPVPYPSPPFLSKCHTMACIDSAVTNINSNAIGGNRMKLLIASRMRRQQQKQKQSPVQASVSRWYLNGTPVDDCDAVCMDPYCNSVDLIPIEGYITCRACGLCQAPVIDSQDEKRYHEEQPGGPSNTSHRANSSTVGNSVVSDLVPATVLGTTIGKSYGGGKRGDAKYMRTIRREGKYRQYSSQDSATLKKLSHIANICKSVGINKRTIEEIQWTFHKLSNIKSNKRRKHQALMATATIIGCRECGVEKDITEIATKFDLDIRILRRMVKQYEMVWADIKEEDAQQEAESIRKSQEDYQRELDSNHIVRIEPEIQSDTISIANITDDSDSPIDSIQKSINKNDNMKLLKYLRKLPIPECYHGIIFNINDWINTNNTLAQHIPISRYASVIYLATQLFNLDINKLQIVAVCGISEVTIKKCYAKLGNIEESMRAILEA